MPSWRILIPLKLDCCFENGARDSDNSLELLSYFELILTSPSASRNASGHCATILAVNFQFDKWNNLGCGLVCMHPTSFVLRFLAPTAESRQLNQGTSMHIVSWSKFGQNLAIASLTISVFSCCFNVAYEGLDATSTDHEDNYESRGSMFNVKHLANPCPKYFETCPFLRTSLGI